MSQAIWPIQADMGQTDPTKNNYVEGQAGAQATASANAAALIAAAVAALNLGTAATQASGAFDASGLAATAQTAAIASAAASLTAAVAALATVGRTGVYSDLTSKPTLGTAAALPSGTFATAAQGALAASALQSFTETDPVASPALTTHAALTTAAHGGIVASSDSRLSNARTPTTHASTHASGGSDPVSGLLTPDTGWTANTYAGVKTAVLVSYSTVITGTMSTALNLTSAGLGASLVTMDQTLQLLVQQVAALRTAMVASKLPNV
jgi:hypothetical protein